MDNLYIERLFQQEIMSGKQFKGIVMPGFTPPMWRECDVFEITPAGFFREYEIKLSRADFLKDRTKEIQIAAGRDEHRRIIWEWKRKHALLADGYEKGPNNFFFVAPPNIIDLKDVPKWAGLIEIAQHPGNSYHGDFLHSTVIKRAPRLHAQKCSEDYMARARTVAYNRYHVRLSNTNVLERMTLGEAEYDRRQQKKENAPL